MEFRVEKWASNDYRVSYRIFVGRGEKKITHDNT